MYYYTHLKQDGTYVVLEQTATKWEYERLKKFTGGYIEYMPDDYLPKGMSGQVIGDEEGRLNSTNHRNPFMRVLTDDMGNEWYCVGDLLLEQTEKQFNKWQKSLIDVKELITA